MNSIDIIPIGAKVLINRSGQDAVEAQPIEAQVVSVMIEGIFDVQYRCVWWNDRTRVSEWIESCELVVDENTSRTKLGFISAGHEGADP